MTTIILRSVRILAAIVFILSFFRSAQAAEQLLVVYAGHNESVAPMWV